MKEILFFNKDKQRYEINRLINNIELKVIRY